MCGGNCGAERVGPPGPQGGEADRRERIWGVFG